MLIICRGRGNELNSDEAIYIRIFEFWNEAFSCRLSSLLNSTSNSYDQFSYISLLVVTLHIIVKTR